MHQRIAARYKLRTTPKRATFSLKISKRVLKMAILRRQIMQVGFCPIHFVKQRLWAWMVHLQSKKYFLLSTKYISHVNRRQDRKQM